MQVTYELQLTDWRASDRFFAARQKSARSGARGWWFFRALLILFLLPTVAAPLRYLDSPEFKTAWKASGIGALWPLSIAAIPLVALAIAWFGAPLLQNVSFRNSPFYGKKMTLSIERGGLRGEAFAPWPEVHAVEETPEHIFVVFGDNRVFIIPKRAFESDFDAAQFAAKCRDGRVNAHSSE